MQYINDLSGEGARLFGGRWNREGDGALYFCEHLSLCVLELLARINFEFLTFDYGYLEAEISATYFESVDNPSTISIEWRNNPHISATQDYGSNWLVNKENLGLVIPSAILPRERNIIINPLHKAFQKLKVLTVEPLNLDNRLHF